MRNVQVSLRLSALEADLINDAAALQERTVSDVMRRAIVSEAERVVRRAPKAQLARVRRARQGVQ